MAKYVKFSDRWGIPLVQSQGRLRPSTLNEGDIRKGVERKGHLSIEPEVEETGDLYLSYDIEH